MKKLICMILALIMVMSLCACGEKASDNGQNNNSVNETGTSQNESTDTSIEAVKDILVGTWLPDGYGENQDSAELLKFNEDGTVEMLGATYTWEIKSAGTKDSARISLYDGETCFYNVKYSVRDGVCNHLSLEHVRSSGDKYKLEKAGYHREADYQVIDITLENYTDYFEIMESAFVTEDSFGDAAKIAIYRGIGFKEEHGKVNHTISQGAFEYTYLFDSVYEVTADKTTGEYTYGEKVKDGLPNTDVSDCKNQANLGDRYGVIIDYAQIDSFPSDQIFISEEVTVTRAIGKIFVYTPIE